MGIYAGCCRETGESSLFCGSFYVRLKKDRFIFLHESVYLGILQKVQNILHCQVYEVPVYILFLECGLRRIPAISSISIEIAPLAPRMAEAGVPFLFLSPCLETGRGAFLDHGIIAMFIFTEKKII